MKKYTISDIARHAGVSASTVSRVLNAERNHVPVSEELRVRIEEAMAKFEYAPNLNAQRLSTNRSYIIGLQLPSRRQLQNIFRDFNFEVTMNGIEEALEGSRYKLLLLFRSDDYMQKQEYLQLLRSRSIDGMLIWGTLLEDCYDPALSDYPALFLNTTPQIASNFNYLVHDEFTGAKQLTIRLLNEGAKRFLYLIGPRSNSIVEERYRGFRVALEQNGINFDPETSLLEVPFDRQQASTLFHSFAPAVRQSMDAIVCSSDMLAFGVADAVQEWQLPQPLLIAGADGLESPGSNTIFSMKVNHHQLGQSAVNAILHLINSPARFQEALPISMITK